MNRIWQEIRRKRRKDKMATILRLGMVCGWNADKIAPQMIFLGLRPGGWANKKIKKHTNIKLQMGEMQIKIGADISIIRGLARTRTMS